jgi:hypothetical protein
MIEDMMKSETKGCDFPVIEVLTLIFVAAKLFGYINWSWWLVLSPIWISLLADVCMAVVLAIMIWVNEIFFEK